MSNRPLSRLMAVFPLIFMAGCATNEQRLDAAAAKQADITVGRTLPTPPDDCRLRARSGVQVGDRQDVALLKTDEALSRQNDRTRRCIEWYQRIKQDIEGLGTT